MQINQKGQCKVKSLLFSGGNFLIHYPTAENIKKSKTFELKIEFWKNESIVISFVI